jgi:hypothetical protein
MLLCPEGYQLLGDWQLQGLGCLASWQGRATLTCFQGGFQSVLFTNLQSRESSTAAAAAAMDVRALLWYVVGQRSGACACCLDSYLVTRAQPA